MQKKTCEAHAASQAFLFALRFALTNGKQVLTIGKRCRLPGFYGLSGRLSAVAGTGHGTARAGAAAGGAAAAGGLPGLPVADHAAHDEKDRRGNCRDQEDVDVIYSKPGKHMAFPFR